MGSLKSRQISPNLAKKMLDLTLENEYRLSITIDIEDWYHIPSVTGSPFSVYKDVDEFFDKWTGRYDYLSLRKPTKRVLDMLDEFDIKATFFVVADVVDHFLSGIGGINC